MQRRLEFHCVQTVVGGDTEAGGEVEEVVASGQVEDVETQEDPSMPLGVFVVDSEVAVVAGSLRILNIG